MNLKGNCPKCGLIDVVENNGEDGSDGPSWGCPRCEAQLDTVQCRQCRRFVSGTWYGYCLHYGCDYEPPSPEKINEVLADLERILNDV